MVFATMELEFQKHFMITTTDELKKTFLAKLLMNEELQFYWSLISVKWGEESMELL